ncbi:MAG: argininosuccinate synthase [Armatimonadota bacterium]|nr:argininosuccinate synthase [Armatimonadota bacterium]MDR7451253.1 argininosuccinate synthase [Armatimonadota bacterium]MDR7466844.1 argininosuccinate synthase [Armatimonadota bacterium]MDR7492683.1 argininosuccinate synthase [Armatimonadota bacterium]MDR7499612.1 argininosuccinate synthase [Armatimonadota bacterium]
MTGVHKVVLAYSGGLDTSVIIPWLREHYGARVIAVIVDVGQPEDIAAIRAKALHSGAEAAVVVDAKEEFVSEYCFRALRANAIYEGQYLLGTALARPVIAKAQVEVALAEGADAVAHGCTGKGNDQVRFELAYKALAPQLRVIAPWREWTLASREEEIEYAAAHGIPVPATREKPYSVDQNLWHRSAEAGLLEDPWREPPEEVYALTTAPAQAPDEPAYVEITFAEGIPVAVDGRPMSAAAIVAALNRLGGAHGVGRTDLVENRLVGIKSRGVYETPGGTILAAAHRDLETITLDRDTQHYAALIAPRYAELVYYGQWFSPLRQAFDGFFAAAQRTVTGTVRMKLFKGTCTAVGRQSPYSLYRQDLATFGADAVYNQKDAEGFINLWALPSQVFAATNPALIRKGLRHPVK